MIDIVAGAFWILEASKDESNKLLGFSTVLVEVLADEGELLFVLGECPVRCIFPLLVLFLM